MQRVVQGDAFQRVLLQHLLQHLHALLDDGQAVLGHLLHRVVIVDHLVAALGADDGLDQRVRGRRGLVDGERVAGACDRELVDLLGQVERQRRDDGLADLHVRLLRR